jgi:hypothetical protein
LAKIKIDFSDFFGVGNADAMSLFFLIQLSPFLTGSLPGNWYVFSMGVDAELASQILRNSSTESSHGVER